MDEKYNNNFTLGVLTFSNNEPLKTYLTIGGQVIATNEDFHKVILNQETLEKNIEAALQREQKLIQALKFYADPNTWEHKLEETRVSDLAYSVKKIINHDYGDLARVTLKELSIE